MKSKETSYLLRCNNLSLGYKTQGNKILLHEGLNLSLEAGKVYCLVGPNGAGKSTLIKTLAGIIPSLGGCIYFNDTNAKDLSPSEISKSLSIVLTDKPYTERFRVYDMVAMGRQPYTGFLGKLGKKDHQEIEIALQSMGIHPLKDRFFGDLSDGEQQKVMIAKSLAQQTPILMLDEPTAFLDFSSKIEVMILLRNIARNSQKSVILSSHDINLAFRLSDEIILMAKGNQCVQDTPETMIQKNHMMKYFRNEIFRFDNQRLSFEPVINVGLKARVKVDDDVLALVKNILSRNNFVISGDDNFEMSIIQQSNEFAVKANQTEVVLKNLSGLSHYICQYVQKNNS